MIDAVVEPGLQIVNEQFTQYRIEQHPIASFLNNTVLADFKFLGGQFEEPAVNVHSVDLLFGLRAFQSDGKGDLELRALGFQ